MVWGFQGGRREVTGSTGPAASDKFAGATACPSSGSPMYGRADSGSGPRARCARPVHGADRGGASSSPAPPPSAASGTCSGACSATALPRVCHCIATACQAGPTGSPAGGSVCPTSPDSPSMSASSGCVGEADPPPSSRGLGRSIPASARARDRLPVLCSTPPCSPLGEAGAWCGSSPPAARTMAAVVLSSALRARAAARPGKTACSSSSSSSPSSLLWALWAAPRTEGGARRRRAPRRHHGRRPSPSSSASDPDPDVAPLLSSREDSRARWRGREAAMAAAKRAATPPRLRSGVPSCPGVAPAPASAAPDGSRPRRRATMLAAMCMRGGLARLAARGPRPPSRRRRMHIMATSRPSAMPEHAVRYSVASRSPPTPPSWLCSGGGASRRGGAGPSPVYPARSASKGTSGRSPASPRMAPAASRACECLALKSAKCPAKESATARALRGKGCLPRRRRRRRALSPSSLPEALASEACHDDWLASLPESSKPCLRSSKGWRFLRRRRTGTWKSRAPTASMARRRPETMLSPLS